MYNHAPTDYKCPICLAISGIENDDTFIRKADLVYKDDLVSAYVNSFFFGKTKGSVFISPNKHFENVYDLPSEYGYRIFDVAQKMALALKKAYKCEGITILQNNEPASEQHAFHYHFHLFPRFRGDSLRRDLDNKKVADPIQRTPFAERLRKVFDEQT